MSRRRPGTDARRRRATGVPGRGGQVRLGLVLVAPTVCLELVFFIFPLASAVYFAFTDWDGVSRGASFVGLDNLTKLVGDSEMWHALANNAVWVVLGTAAPVGIGLVLAVVLWSGVRGVLGYRLALFLPYVLPPVAIGIVWSWIYDPLNGWLNRALESVGLDALSRGWLGDPTLALYAVLAAAIWAAFGFALVVFLAALRNVDLDLVDAARLDGANAARRLWHVILPQIMPVFLMVTTIELIGGLSVFDIVFVMTGGGPNNQTEVLGTYAYENAFELSQIGYGTTLALLITMLSLPFVIALNRLQRGLSTERGA